MEGLLNLFSWMVEWMCRPAGGMIPKDNWVSKTGEFLATLPPEVWYFLALLACLGALIGFISVYGMLAVWLERKISAHIQDRLGPMYVGGWHGWAQSIADGLKLLVKEDIVPAQADGILFRMAPYVMFAAAFAAFVCIPFDGLAIVTDLNIGLFYILAISSLAIVAVLMGSWGSNNKWSLFGGMRSAAQIISYEIPVGLALMCAVLLAGTLSMTGIVQAQASVPGEVQVLAFTSWFAFANPFCFVAMGLYFIGALAECNRAPFDIPEAESELVAGFHTEYSGMRFSFFFLSEYANMFMTSAVLSVCFLGGWLGPVNLQAYGSDNPALRAISAGPHWIILKSMALVCVQIWIRWTLPRLRVDQLMSLCWKYMIPLAFVCLAEIAITMVWPIPAGRQWAAFVLICTAMVAGVRLQDRLDARRARA